MNRCMCDKLTKLSGRQGQDYALKHLVEVKVDKLKWQILYICPLTGKYWKEYFTHPEAHGGGIPEYMQISEKQAKEEFGI